jgi:hypothetical protein
MSKSMPSSKSAKSIRASIIRHLRKWHRKLGILAAFFLIFLSVTGIGLNHTETLALTHQPITSPWLLEHYGIKNPADIRFYQQKQLVVTDQYAWLGKKLLLESPGLVLSMGKFQQYWLVLSASQLSVYNSTGDLVDRLTSSTGLPDGITAMAITADSVIVNTYSGYYQTDENMLGWQPITTIVTPQWLSAEQVSQQDIAEAQLRYKSQFLNLEQIVLDAHSGRIFGDLGVYFMDLVAVALILLSLSGIYIWIRYSQAKR